MRFAHFSSAEQNHRSLNGEALAWLEREAFAEKPKRAKEILAALRAGYRLLSRRAQEDCREH